MISGDTPEATTADQAQTRRRPVQARSRDTVERILTAATELIEESGVDAASTRAIAGRAGVSAPSLYRFFADRDEILDEILKRQLHQLDAHAEHEESGWRFGSVEEFVGLELDLHVDFYEQHPSFARLWFGGRVSPTVVAEVHGRNRALASRARRVLVDAGMIKADTAPGALDLLVELGDRVLEMAFREGPKADPEVIEMGRGALIACLQGWITGGRSITAEPEGSNGQD